MDGALDVPVLVQATDSAAMPNTNERLVMSPNVFILESFSKLRNFVVDNGPAKCRCGDGTYLRLVSEI